MKGPDDALGIDDDHRTQGKAGICIENAETLRSLAMREKIRQQRVTDSTQTLRPDFQCGHGVAREAQQAGAFFFKLLQRTVEVGGLIASPAGEGERVGRDHDPVRTLKLAKRYFAAVMRLELEFRCCRSDICHGVLLGTKGL